MRIFLLSRFLNTTMFYPDCLSISKCSKVPKYQNNVTKNLSLRRSQKAPFVVDFCITISIGGSCLCVKCLSTITATLSLFHSFNLVYNNLQSIMKILLEVIRNVSVSLILSSNYIIPTTTSFYVSKINPPVYLDFHLIWISFLTPD